MRKGREDGKGEGEGENKVRRKEGGKRGASLVPRLLRGRREKNLVQTVRACT